jgi:hypothetical protein
VRRISAAKTAFLEPEALTESDMRSGNTGPREVTKGNKFSRKLHSAAVSRHQVSRPQSLYLCPLQSVFAFESDGVTDGIISPGGELYKNGFAWRGAGAQVVELRSRPIGG